MFHSLEVETARMMGSYDGRQIAITRSASTLHEVAIHENIHERIYHETLDGMLHRNIIYFSTGQNGCAHKKRAEFLLNDTRVAHEAAATYLGIQSLDTLKERQQAFLKLPDEYIKYYLHMHEILVKLTASSYLAFSLGWALAYWCFSSPRLFDLYAGGWSEFDEIVARNSPTDRLKEIAKFLNSGRNAQSWKAHTEAYAARGMSELGLDMWDLENDAEWEARAESEAPRLEALLTEGAVSWLRNNGPCPTADPFDRPPGIEEWLTAQLEAAGIQTHFIEKDTEFDFAPEKAVLRAALRAQRASKSHIVNDHRTALERLPTRASDDWGEARRRLDPGGGSSFFTAAAADPEGTDWAIYAFAKASGSDPASVSRKYLVEQDFAVDLISRSRKIGGPVDRPICLFLAPADDILLPRYSALFADLFAHLASESGAATGDPTSGDFPAWYWTSDWLDIHTRKGAKTAALLVQISGSAVPEKYILHVATADDVPGYLIALKSTVAGDAIVGYERLLQEAGHLGALPNGVAESVLNCLNGHFSILMDNWARL